MNLWHFYESYTFPYSVFCPCLPIRENWETYRTCISGGARNDQYGTLLNNMFSDSTRADFLIFLWGPGPNGGKTSINADLMNTLALISQSCPRPLKCCLPLKTRIPCLSQWVSTLLPFLWGGFPLWKRMSHCVDSNGRSSTVSHLAKKKTRHLLIRGYVWSYHGNARLHIRCLFREAAQMMANEIIMQMPRCILNTRWTDCLRTWLSQAYCIVDLKDQWRSKKKQQKKKHLAQKVISREQLPGKLFENGTAIEIEHNGLVLFQSKLKKTRKTNLNKFVTQNE